MPDNRHLSDGFDDPSRDDDKLAALAGAAHEYALSAPGPERVTLPKKPTRRTRGNHSTQAKCPHPEWFPPADYKQLPGEFGHAMRRLVVKDRETGQMRLRQRISHHPYFIQYQTVAGRQRRFRPERRALIDVLFPLLIQRADIATWIVTVAGQDLADELSPKDAGGNVVHETRVEPCRLSRLFPVLARYGLIEMSEQVWDPEHKHWMPRHVVLTERFWQLLGVDMDKLLFQRNQRIEKELEALRTLGIEEAAQVEAGTGFAVHVVRENWYERMRMATLKSRQRKASRGKLKKTYSTLPLDERRNRMAARLMRQLPAHELMRLSPEDFDRLVWQHINQLGMGLGYDPSPPVVH